MTLASWSHIVPPALSNALPGPGRLCLPTVCQAPHSTFTHDSQASTHLHTHSGNHLVSPCLNLNNFQPVERLLKDSEHSPVVDILLCLSIKLIYVIHICIFTHTYFFCIIDTEMFLETSFLFILSISENVSCNEDIYL